MFYKSKVDLRRLLMLLDAAVGMTRHDNCVFFRTG